MSLRNVEKLPLLLVVVLIVLIVGVKSGLEQTIPIVALLVCGYVLFYVELLPNEIAALIYALASSVSLKRMAIWSISVVTVAVVLVLLVLRSNLIVLLLIRSTD